jgi:hypothetical protein
VGGWKEYFKATAEVKNGLIGSSPRQAVSDSTP